MLFLSGIGVRGSFLVLTNLMKGEGIYPEAQQPETKGICFQILEFGPLESQPRSPEMRKPVSQGGRDVLRIPPQGVEDGAMASAHTPNSSPSNMASKMLI